MNLFACVFYSSCKLQFQIIRSSGRTYKICQGKNVIEIIGSVFVHVEDYFLQLKNTSITILATFEPCYTCTTFWETVPSLLLRARFRHHVIAWNSRAACYMSIKIS